MCEALMEIMEPEIRLREKALKEAAIQKGMQEGIQKGIQGSVHMLRKLGHQDNEIKALLLSEYDLSAEEVERYFS